MQETFFDELKSLEVAALSGLLLTVMKSLIDYQWCQAYITFIKV